MNHADQEAAAARRSGRGRRQGRLGHAGGRPLVVSGRPSPSSPLFRLKRSVEVFPAADGSLYLLRLGAGDDARLPDPSPADRALLELLSSGFKSEAELRRGLGGEGIGEDWIADSLAELNQAGLLERRNGAPLLDEEQAERYDRQLIYFADLAEPGQMADELQLRLARAHVVLLGCGGLGSWVACGLSCAGVGSLTLIDDDRVELSNLNRQLLFTEADIGQPKIDVAAQALRAHNSALEIQRISRRIRGPNDLTDVLASQPDLLVATADWPPHDLPRWVNRACIAAGVPWIGAGQFPPRLRVGPLVVPGQSACHECLEQAARYQSPLYDQIAKWRAQRRTIDCSVGPISGVIGSLLATEALHFLLGACRPASVNHALLLDLRTMGLSSERVERQPDCPCCSAAGAKMTDGVLLKDAAKRRVGQVS